MIFFWLALVYVVVALLIGARYTWLAVTISRRIQKKASGLQIEFPPLSPRRLARVTAMASLSWPWIIIWRGLRDLLIELEFTKRPPTEEQPE